MRPQLYCSWSPSFCMALVVCVMFVSGLFEGFSGQLFDNDFLLACHTPNTFLFVCLFVCLCMFFCLVVAHLLHTMLQDCIPDRYRCKYSCSILHGVVCKYIYIHIHTYVCFLYMFFLHSTYTYSYIKYI